MSFCGGRPAPTPPPEEKGLEKQAGPQEQLRKMWAPPAQPAEHRQAGLGPVTTGTKPSCSHLGPGAGVRLPHDWLTPVTLSLGLSARRDGGEDTRRAVRASVEKLWAQILACPLLVGGR